MKGNVFILIFSLALIFSCSKDDEDGNASDPQLTPMEIVTELLVSFEKKDTTAAMQYVSENQFTQHNLGMEDGRQGYINAIVDGDLAGVQVDIFRSFEDENYVISHSEYLMDGNPVVVFDVFRFDNDMIVEHWDNRQSKIGPNVSNHEMTDGTEEIADNDQTDQNKKIISQYLQEIFVDGYLDSLGNYFNEGVFIEHNPVRTDSVTHLDAFLRTQIDKNQMPLYSQVHKVLGQGNFVLTMSEGDLDQVPMAFYDLFRLEDGKIVEHWDVVQEIPPESSWMHSNGKF